MVFPTLQFILFFTAVLTINQALSGSSGWRKAFLIAASYTFYGAWDVRFLTLMAAVSAVAYLAGRFVGPGSLGKTIRNSAIVLLLLLLGVFKYFNFFVLPLQQLLIDTALARDLTWMRVILPVGISFYTFQAISYILDVGRGQIAPRRNPADVFLYISFFPQLVAGPIVRAADFLPQIDLSFHVSSAMRGTAVLLILTGLFKKMVVANYLSALLVDPVFSFPDIYGSFEATLAVFGYGIQIYCDFSGYSDIAIGVALLLGYRFHCNFNQPYRAHSLANFWQRWHISLSEFIRDYLYIPLGGNRGSVAKRSWNLMLTMTLAGLWHGAGWNFIVWGALHGGGLLVERVLIRVRALRAISFLAFPITLVVVLTLWIPFRAADLSNTQAMFAAIVRGSLSPQEPILPIVYVLLAIGLAMNWLPLLWRDHINTALGQIPVIAQALVLATGVILCFAAAQDGMPPFIYFQF